MSPEQAPIWAAQCSTQREAVVVSAFCSAVRAAVDSSVCLSVSGAIRAASGAPHRDPERAAVGAALSAAQLEPFNVAAFCGTQHATIGPALSVASVTPNEHPQRPAVRAAFRSTVEPAARLVSATDFAAFKATIQKAFLSTH